jgi:limonene-1,2-epoxide hydrolase
VNIVTATATSNQTGPLTAVVHAFVAAQGEVLAKGVTQASDWDPVAKFVDPARFRRVGAYLEELDWEAYKDFLTGWASGGTRFEMTVFHISEIGNAVFQEIEERHHRGDEFIRKNVIAVYRFDDQRRLVHLDIYEQAKDSGDWIKDAAREAMGA